MVSRSGLRVCLFLDGGRGGYLNDRVPGTLFALFTTNIVLSYYIQLVNFSLSHFVRTTCLAFLTAIPHPCAACFRSRLTAHLLLHYLVVFIDLSA